MTEYTSKNLFQLSELEAFISEEFLDDYDIEAIIEDATEIDYRTGNRYWAEGIDLAEICAKHEYTGKHEA